MSTLVEIKKADPTSWGPLKLPEGMGPPPQFKRPTFNISTEGFPQDWVRPEHGREGTKAARKAKILRGVKVGGGAAAATAGVGAAALAASRALRKPAAEVSRQVSPKTIAAVGTGGVVAGTGGGLVLRKRKKEQP